MSKTVTIRMYNPGFGDCFRVTVHDGDQVWRLLVDCGVHSHGRAQNADGTSRSIDEVVAAVISDLTADCDGDAHLDVVVATHHHADHISGFASAAWDAVAVDEVWVSFVEDPTDPDATALRNGTAAAADALRGLAEHAVAATRGEPSAHLALALELAANSSPNATAMGRLTAGRFRGTPARVRFLPSKDAAANEIAVGAGAVVHVLGPSRDPHELARMDPPASAHWLADAEAEGAPGTDREDLFDPVYRVPRDAVRELIDPEALRARTALRLRGLGSGDEALLAAASVLERSVNNTSVFFVLDVAGERFVFVGDSQEGAWEHVLDDDAARALVSAPRFYKVGHHGSHNATPKRFVMDVLGEDAYAMVPVGFVKEWAAQIPFPALISALEDHRTHLFRADQPQPASHEGDVTVTADPAGMWSELAFQLA